MIGLWSLVNDTCFRIIRLPEPTKSFYFEKLSIFEFSGFVSIVSILLKRNSVGDVEEK